MRDLPRGIEERERESRREAARRRKKHGPRAATPKKKRKRKARERDERSREGAPSSRPPLLVVPPTPLPLPQKNPKLTPRFPPSLPRSPPPLSLSAFRRNETKQNEKKTHTARPSVAPLSRRRRASVSARAAPKGDPNQKMMWEALREAVDEEMERDPTVCLMGEDVGHYGGSYKVTYDLYKKYGDLRLLDTPICENGFMGVGIGAAMTGLRVIIEGMNMGFLLLAYNQISNNAGMLHYTSGGQFKVPVVIRGPGGVGRQLGAEHSQRLESYFQSIPGVQLVACSTAANAKALLKSAIRSDNPVSGGRLVVVVVLL